MGKLALCLSFLAFFNLSIAIANDITNSDLLFVEASEAVKVQNYVTALTIFEKLSENGEHDAQYNLALLQKSGKGKPQNYASALKWSWLSLLGNIQQAGKLVNDLKDLLPEQAMKTVRSDVLEFLKPRAESGDLQSIKQMGKYFLVVPEEPDYKESYLWFLIASAFQIEGTMESRDQVENELESKDIIKIQESASKLYEGIYQKIK
jgi:hypothetical protein